jgi:hypothetical protein
MSSARFPAEPRANATGLSGGSLRLSLPPARLPARECHRLARWFVTLIATAGPPPNRPLRAVRQADKAARTAYGPDAVAPNDSRPPHPAVTASVSHHRASRWHSCGAEGRQVAMSVNHHRASQWHSCGVETASGSNGPPPPPGCLGPFSAPPPESAAVRGGGLPDAPPPLAPCQWGDGWPLPPALPVKLPPPPLAPCQWGDGWPLLPALPVKSLRCR